MNICLLDTWIGASASMLNFTKGDKKKFPMLTFVVNNCIFVSKHNFIKMKSIKGILSIAVVSALVMSCGNKDGNKVKSSAVAEIDDVSVEQIIEDLENIPTPTSLDLMSTINKLGIAYIYDVTNSLSNCESYLSTRQKALNIGVYSTDLSYDVTYQKKAETEEYLKCILGMASDLNISIDIDKIGEKFQNNIDDVETLATAVRDLVSESQYILNQTSQTETALLFLIGSWVEGAYICVSAFETSSTNDEYIDIVLQHFNYAETILKYLETKKDDADFASFQEQFSNLKTLVDNFKNDRQNEDARESLVSAVEALRGSII